MKLVAAIAGDLRQMLAAEVRAGERAAMSAIRAETEQVKAELRQQVTSAFGGNARGVANAWRSQVFPTSGESLRPAGLVFTKLPNIIDAFERGVTIRPKGSQKFLAIPTGFNRQGGRRGAKPRVTSQQMVASGQAFLRPFKSGRSLVWYLSMRESAIAALHSMSMAALASRNPAPPMLRGETIPQRLPPGGLVVLRDGETIEETAILSPLAWAIQHRAEVEITVTGATSAARNALLDAPPAPRSSPSRCPSPSPGRRRPARGVVPGLRGAGRPRPRLPDDRRGR
jgi:hypothetical protein